jgi:hypothetical protein
MTENINECLYFLNTFSTERVKDVFVERFIPLRILGWVWTGNDATRLILEYLRIFLQLQMLSNPERGGKMSMNG